MFMIHCRISAPHERASIPKWVLVDATAHIQWPHNQEVRRKSTCVQGFESLFEMRGPARDAKEVPEVGDLRSKKSFYYTYIIQNIR